MMTSSSHAKNHVFCHIFRIHLSPLIYVSHVIYMFTCVTVALYFSDTVTKLQFKCWSKYRQIRRLVVSLSSKRKLLFLCSLISTLCHGSPLRVVFILHLVK